jgi:hypothetical protein
MSREKVEAHARKHSPLLFSNSNCREALPRNPKLDIPKSIEKRSYPVTCEADFGGLTTSPSKGWFPS